MQCIYATAFDAYRYWRSCLLPSPELRWSGGASSDADLTKTLGTLMEGWECSAPSAALVHSTRRDPGDMMPVALWTSVTAWVLAQAANVGEVYSRAALAIQ